MALRRPLAILTVLVALAGCSDDDGDLVPNEPEVGEEDREIVPGEGGPVD